MGDKPFRQEPRIRTTLRVRLYGDAVTMTEGFWTTTRDLGSGGAFIRCDAPFAPGTRLRLSIEADAAEPPLEVEAEVRWVAPPGATEQGVGVAFVSPSPEVRRRLEQVLSHGELPILELYDDA